MGIVNDKEPQMKLRIGNVIKSYDFVNNTTCFYLGQVREIRDGMAVCDTLGQTWDNQEVSDFPAEFRTPLPGNFRMDEMYPEFKRIEVVK
jgi:hypothetical protein